MAKYSIVFTEEYKKSSLSFWVHEPLDAEVWNDATQYKPPLPKKVIGSGYKVYKIEHKGCEFIFSSIEEVEHCITLLSPKVLKTTRDLADNSWVKGYQHMHWLSKWPGKLKSHKDRQAIVKLLNKLKELDT